MKEELRGQGIGSQLLQQARVVKLKETVALLCKCCTLQAPDFYQKYGYKENAL